MSSAIPLDDAGFDGFLNNWRTLLTATPATYGMLAGDATAISNAYTTWHTAFLLILNPVTRTHPNIVAKDIAKASGLVLLRDQYGIIKANPAVLDANKANIGVRVNDPVPTPIPPPATYPLLDIVNSASLEQTVTMHDSATPTIRRKPTGSIGALVYRSVGLTAALDPAQLAFMGFFSRANFTGDTFDASDVGKVASYAARWTTATGLEGPWSAIYTKTVSN